LHGPGCRRHVSGCYDSFLLGARQKHCSYTTGIRLVFSQEALTPV
jgi:hypothetical protein